MNDINEVSKILEEAISKCIDNILNNDIECGSKLLDGCKAIHYQNAKCDFQYKQQVVNYLETINFKYQIFIKIYNFLNKKENTNIKKQDITCDLLPVYLMLLENIKEAKKYADAGNKLIELFKKEGDTNE